VCLQIPTALTTAQRQNIVRYFHVNSSTILLYFFHVHEVCMTAKCGHDVVLSRSRKEHHDWLQQVCIFACFYGPNRNVATCCKSFVATFYFSYFHPHNAAINCAIFFFIAAFILFYFTCADRRCAFWGFCQKTSPLASKFQNFAYKSIFHSKPSWVLAKAPSKFVVKTVK